MAGGPRGVRALGPLASVMRLLQSYCAEIGRNRQRASTYPSSKKAFDG
ncbi:hypothetical protein PEX1_055250 [Penicillium expansum]|uniref:Uncharacterized protein n=1 Tax=Penicillium expansum TaxID=27334 RepID=A0A0A2J4J0_PENEN|nr:hypothetical protein PEX2_044430 [Penicillium expansum]KGO44880.1 hypothetical protein PEX1_055250 [Penicillium expansum]KGO47315.1 hypothetical protein PEXP_081140 [Penicillium expansum]KGO62920.1 hypothetical protein PEX2_044430 [Penicillium expansum]